MSHLQPESPTPDELSELQKTHIDFLADYFSDLQVRGVPVVTCINYKTIQVLNNLGLKAMMADTEKVGDDA